MPLLDAMIAFAVTMLAVATAVTTSTRFIQTLCKTKRQGLKDFLGEFYAQEIEPTLRTELTQLGSQLQDASAKKLQEVAKKLVDEMQVNPGLPPGADGKASEEMTEDQARKLVNVSTREMIERLRRSEFGIELQKQLKGGAEKVFDKLAERYEAVGERATESFRGKTRILATLIAMVIAFSLNIDSLRLATTYMNDREVRGIAIGQTEIVLARAASVIESTATPELVEALDQVRSEINKLSNSSIPIGWTYFPYSQGVPQEQRTEPELGNLLLWIIGCLLTGLLAGLGAPFWHDLLSRMTSAAIAAKGGKKK